MSSFLLLPSPQSSCKQLEIKQLSHFLSSFLIICVTEQLSTRNTRRNRKNSLPLSQSKIMSSGFFFFFFSAAFFLSFLFVFKFTCRRASLNLNFLFANSHTRTHQEISYLIIHVIFTFLDWIRLL